MRRQRHMKILVGLDITLAIFITSVRHDLVKHDRLLHELIDRQVPMLSPHKDGPPRFPRPFLNSCSLWTSSRVKVATLEPYMASLSTRPSFSEFPQSFGHCDSAGAIPLAERAANQACSRLQVPVENVFP